MAGELVVNFAFVFNKNNVNINEASWVLRFVIAIPVASNNQFAQKAFSAIVADTALPLGPVTAPGWLFIQNKDATNFITLKRAVGGATIAKILPGEPWCGRLDPGITVPSTAADTAPCNIDYAVLGI